MVLAFWKYIEYFEGNNILYSSFCIGHCTTNLLSQTSFEEVLSYFSSVLMVSVQEKSNPFGTISMYASFFEFCVICLRGTRIGRTGGLDTVTEILELSCNQRRDLIGIACRVFNCFLGGLINSESDDEDITSFVKYGMSMMSLSLGMLYSSDIRPSSGLSKWPIDYAAKMHPGTNSIIYLVIYVCPDMLIWRW